jgi:hypothetical protein
MAISVRPKVYRDTPGFAIVGKVKDSAGWWSPSYSIFVRCRSTAIRIKKVLNAGLPFEQRSKKISVLIHADARVKSCRR